MGGGVRRLCVLQAGLGRHVDAFQASRCVCDRDGVHEPSVLLAAFGRYVQRRVADSSAKAEDKKGDAASDATPATTDTAVPSARV